MATRKHKREDARKSKEKNMVKRFADGIDAWSRRSGCRSVTWIWIGHTWVTIENCMAGGSARSFRVHAIPKCS